MSRLKNIEKYAIQWLDSQGYEVKEIVNELNLSEKVVVNCLEKYKKANENNKIKTSTSLVGKAENKNLMITQTSGKKNKGVTVMTPEASMSSDAKRNNFLNKSHRDKTAIFNPTKNNE